MDLFAQIANVEHKLAGQLDEDTRTQIGEWINEIDEARLDAKQTEMWSNRLQVPCPESSLESATQKGLKEWMANIQKDLSILILNKVRECSSLLNSTYQLDVTIPEKDRMEVRTVEGFLQVYFRTGNIKNINQAGIEKIKKDFSKQVYFRDRVKDKGKYITFENYVRIEFCPFRKIHELKYYSRDALSDMKKAINLFEFGEPKDHWLFRTLPDGYKSKVSFDKFETAADKVVSWQFYKNGNIKLGFVDESAQKQFMSMFGFDRLTENSRW